MIFLGLGSNLSSSDGTRNRFKNIDTAIKIIFSHEFTMIKKSSYYETPSYPNQNNPKFINVVISLKNKIPNTSEADTLNGLVYIITLIENKYGRKRIKKNEPRTIDIDIIDYNCKASDFKTVDSKTIKIPHERLTLRNFVLYPLKEICPDWNHPVTGKNIDELIDELSDIDKKSILKVQYT